MITKLTRSLLVLALATQIAPVQAAGLSAMCQRLFNTGGAQTKWRAGNTYKNTEGEVAKSTTARERKIRDTDQSMRDDVLNQSATPLMEFFPATGSSISYLKQTGGYGTGEVTRIAVSKLGKTGIFRGTLLLPVSGHTGSANALKWAKSDTYTIWMVVDGKRTALVDNVKSLDVVTIQELAIPLVKGKVVQLLYDRSGSAGPGGFIEGRALELVWDGI